MNQSLETIDLIHLEVLHRFPNSYETNYWLDFFRAGGNGEALRLELLGTREYCWLQKNGENQ